MKKLAVFFPGRKYSVDCPLLYYADFICKQLGYETKYMHYAAHREEISTHNLRYDMENAKKYVEAELKASELQDYDEVVFIAKSVGTVAAGYTRKLFGNIPIKIIYLTPLHETVGFLEGEKDIVIAGTNDSFMEYQKLEKWCSDTKTPLYGFLGLGHSLEADDVDESLGILSQIMKLIKEFLDK